MIPKLFTIVGSVKENCLILLKMHIAGKYMPDCEIKEWNEDNFDVNMIQYTKEAYKHRKYALFRILPDSIF